MLPVTAVVTELYLNIVLTFKRMLIFIYIITFYPRCYNLKMSEDHFSLLHIFFKLSKPQSNHVDVFVLYINVEKFHRMIRFALNSPRHSCALLNG